ncbi:Hypothetical_protein [Hexamita inflata]|uniref:Hypothetical_protein n=1 Tax=Hexamita inflata TaxID=28002 RepID=A0AA86RJS3_9EUKA|nr:Hypothetical protein HINF_LOCUS63401 [Hexamita inflata]
MLIQLCIGKVRTQPFSNHHGTVVVMKSSCFSASLPLWYSTKSFVRSLLGLATSSDLSFHGVSPQIPVPRLTTKMQCFASEETVIVYSSGIVPNSYLKYKCYVLYHLTAENATYDACEYIISINSQVFWVCIVANRIL